MAEARKPTHFGLGGQECESIVGSDQEAVSKLNTGD